MPKVIMSQSNALVTVFISCVIKSLTSGNAGFLVEFGKGKYVFTLFMQFAGILVWFAVVVVFDPSRKIDVRSLFFFVTDSC